MESHVFVGCLKTIAIKEQYVQYRMVSQTCWKAHIHITIVMMCWQDKFVGSRQRLRFRCCVVSMRDLEVLVHEDSCDQSTHISVTQISIICYQPSRRCECIVCSNFGLDELMAAFCLGGNCVRSSHTIIMKIINPNFSTQSLRHAYIPDT